MKYFFTILCLSLVALAAAESGYNYPAPLVPSAQQAPKAAIYSPLQAPPLPSYNAPAPHTPHFGSAAGSQQNYGYSQQQSLAQGQVSQQGYGSAAGAAPVSFPGAAQHGHGQSYSQGNYQQQQYAQTQRQQIVTKDIYIHSAPEEQDDNTIGEELAASAPIRKNYRIVFIKAPSQNLKLASNALRNAQSSNEEKTVIYVLSKKPDLSEVSAQLQQVQNEQKSSKPEVYFIKYKTQEEAARAQQEIQAQYDALGGSTHVSDEGIAPITSVASLRGDGHSGSAIPISQYARSAQQSYSQQAFSSSSGISAGAGIAAPNNGYLPVKAKK